MCPRWSRPSKYRRPRVASHRGESPIPGADYPKRLGPDAGHAPPASRAPPAIIPWGRLRQRGLEPPALRFRDASGTSFHSAVPGLIRSKWLARAISEMPEAGLEPATADYDSAPLVAAAFGCSAFWPLIGRFRAIGRLSAFGSLWALPCPPLAHLADRPPF